MRCDVLVVTALKDELDALLAVSGGAASWIEERDPDGFRYHVRTLWRAVGAPLHVAATWTGAMGETAASERSRALIEHLQPGCLAMCGICAGRRGEVFLGDVIIADRAFSYDHGKLVAVADPVGGRREAIFHDIETYNLRRTWAMDAAYDASDLAASVTGTLRRPPSLQRQCAWVLHGTFDHMQGPGTSPETHPDRPAQCPAWTTVLERLEAAGQLELGGDNMRLTPAGEAAVRRERRLHPDGPPADPPFRVHVGPIGTGKMVRQDPEIFRRLAQMERKVLGLEMEAAAIGYVAERAGIPMVIVKAVSDHADEQKDDGFRKFACEASAWVTLTFLLSRFRVSGTGPVQTIDESLHIQAPQSPVAAQTVGPSDARGSIPPSALVGFAIDVSGSMATSIRNDTGGQLSRMKSFERSIDRLVRDAERAARDASRRAPSSVLCFAYAFGIQGLGVCDLFAAVRAGRDLVPEDEVERLKAKYEAEIRSRYQQYAGVGDLLGRFGLGGVVGAITAEARARGEAEVRDRVTQALRPKIQERLAAAGDTTLTLDELAELWRRERGSLDDADGILFGDTPMRRGLTELQQRFEREAAKHAPDVQRVAFVLSDGESTDGDPREPVRLLKEQGVTIVSCFLTDADIADPRVLSGTRSPSWHRAVEVMFDIASEIDETSEIARFLVKKGWVIRPGARYFVQINHSVVLEEFIEAALVPFGSDRTPG